MTSYVLALDQGTTSSRAILFDAAGQIAASAGRELPQIYPQAGWVEHDPNAIWNTQRDSIQALLEESGVAPVQIAALGIANQRETAVAWQRSTGEPLCNAIVWQCRRTAARCQELEAQGLADTSPAENRPGVGRLLFGSRNSSGFCGMSRAPGSWRRSTTSAWAPSTPGSSPSSRDSPSTSQTPPTHPAPCSTTSMRTPGTTICSRSLASHGRPYREVVPSSGVIENTDPAVFGAAVPIAGIAGDQQAALFGQTCWEPGHAKNTYGTGCFLLSHTGAQAAPSLAGLLTTVAASTHGNAYALEGSVFVAGAAVQWLRDKLGVIATAAESETLARQVPDSGGVVVVPAFTGLGTPYWDPQARGTILGLTLGSTKAHVVRATLEAIALQARDVVETMQQESGVAALQELRADGGATANALLMQTQADLLGIPVVVPAVTETTALGAAYLAGLGVGFWPDAAAVAAQWRVARRYEPQISADEREGCYATWLRAVERARAWATD